MVNLTTLGFILVIIIFLISRSISQKALTFLSPELKVKINEEFANMRKYDLVPFAVIFTIYFIGIYFFTSLTVYFTIFMIISIVIYFFISHRVIFDKFRELNMPEEYVKQMFFSRVIIYIGLFLLLIIILAGRN